MRFSPSRIVLLVATLIAASSVTSSLVARPVEASTCSGTSTTTCTFSYTGTEEQFVVPAGVTSLTVSTVGAGGGNYPSPYHAGGSGGTAVATLAVTPGATLYIDVGGHGADGTRGASATCTGSGVAQGGYNGGGSNNGTEPNGACGGGGGGGASGVYSSSNLSFYGGAALVVAGGGGGAGTVDGGSAGTGAGTPTNANGGNGADCNGNFAKGGGGGTQTLGSGAGGSTTGPGKAGWSGNRNHGGESYGKAGGGGGGYFGGGGGGDFDPVGNFGGCGGSGGAGSSFADPTLTSGVVFGTDTSGTPLVTISYTPPCTTAGGTVTCTFHSSGSWTIPAGSTYARIGAVGAPGGSDGNGHAGGSGASVVTTLSLNGSAPLSLYFVIGHPGTSSTYPQDSACMTAASSDDAHRGGGTGGCQAGDGGGASGAYLDTAYTNPLVIGGGGGGAGVGGPGGNGADPAKNAGTAGPNGGDGASNICGAGGGFGGTSTSPGAGGSAGVSGADAGKPGQMTGAGGDGGNSFSYGYGGGGGGGYHGGGGGGDDSNCVDGGGGGAGSSFIVSSYPANATQQSTGSSPARVGPAINPMAGVSHSSYSVDTSGTPVVTLVYGSSPTAALFSTAGITRRDGRTIFSWTAPSSRGLAGFYLTAHGIRLNHGLIAVHRGHRYRYSVTRPGGGIYLLHAVFTNGEQVTGRFG